MRDAPALAAAIEAEEAVAAAARRERVAEQWRRLAARLALTRDILANMRAHSDDRARRDEVE
jgi:hypothetical protein